MANPVRSLARLWPIVLVALAIVFTPMVALAETDETSVPFDVHSSEVTDPRVVFDVDGDDAATLGTQTVKLRPGTYERCIDRIDVPSWARYLYSWMEEATDNDGHADWLISDRYFQRTTGLSRDGVATPGTILPAWGGYVVSLGVVNTTNLSDISPYINVVHTAFRYDHPEVFWLGGFGHGIIPTSDGRPCAVIWIYGDDSGYHINARDERYAGEVQIKSDIAVRDAQISTILAGTKAMGANAYTKVTYFNHWLTTHNQYNTLVVAQKDPLDDTCYECLCALVGNIGVHGPVCQSYAFAFKVLCDAAGIPCVVTSGMAGGTYYGGHAWNRAEVFGTWYNVDVTWDDPTSSSSKESGPVSGNENERYLLVGSETVIGGKAFSESHEAWNGKSLALSNEPPVSRTAFDPATAPRQTDIAGAVVAVADGTYTGEPQTPAPTASYAGSTLRADIDYYVAFANNVNAGEASLTITGVGSYTGAKTVSFHIAKAKPQITLSSSLMVLTPDGQSKELEISGGEGRTASSRSLDTSVCRASIVFGSTLHVMAVAEGKTTVVVRVEGDANHEAAETELSVHVGELTAIWRLYNFASGEHLFTSDENEYHTLAASGAWADEGLGWLAPKTGAPVWRLYHAKTGKHLYTADANERRVLLASGQGWRDEGMCWMSGTTSSTPVYRLYSPTLPFASAHHYTLDVNEYRTLGTRGWRQEGVAWYASGSE